MPRFYLHLTNGMGVARDDEGVELADAEAAGAQAVQGIRSILADEAKAGRMDLDGRIEIADETGAVVRTISFGEALEIRPGGDRASGRSGG